MLVLSRRERETVLFPTLGISVEVLRTGTRKVQLGIDAPLDIRVIRGELDPRSNGKPELTSLTIREAVDVRERLDAARASIQQAQSEISRGADASAEQSLQLALSCLHQLEDRLSPPTEAESAAVRESAAVYRVGSGVQPIVDAFVSSLN